MGIRCRMRLQHGLRGTTPHRRSKGHVATPSGPGSGLAFCTRDWAPPPYPLLVASFPIPSPFDRAFLLVWPPIRCLWPSTSCLRTVLDGGRGFVLESVVTQICREAGGRAITNVLFRELGFHVFNAPDKSNWLQMAPFWGAMFARGHARNGDSRWSRR